MTGSPLEAPVAFWLGPVPIAEQVVASWAIIAAVVLACHLVTRRLSVGGSRVQSVLELLVETLDAQIEAVVQDAPARYRTLVGTLFVFILIANWSGMIPGVEPATAFLETDAALAAIVFAATVGFGIRAHGFLGYIGTFARPTWAMIPLNLIEQITRTFSLMVRLFGNVMSGMFVVGIVLSLAGLLVPIPLMALDLVTGTVQAYIFAILSAVFIASAVSKGAEDRHPTGARPYAGKEGSP